MRILIYGSTFITALVEKELMKHHDVVGHIPSHNPVFPGKMKSPWAHEKFGYDIKLSIQYNKKIDDVTRAYNLHTGLLPMYGGCDIIYHTLENGEKEQGLTFHKMTDKFDEGEIISKITYPVFKDDTALDLYKRICSLAPKFATTAIELMKSTNYYGIDAQKPILYKRGEGILRPMKYEQDKLEILNYVKTS